MITFLQYSLLNNRASHLPSLQLTELFGTSFTNRSFPTFDNLISRQISVHHFRQCRSQPDRDAVSGRANCPLMDHGENVSSDEAGHLI